MVVSEVEKLSILTFREYETHLLTLFQNMQNLEIVRSLSDITSEESALLDTLNFQEQSSSHFSSTSDELQQKVYEIEKMSAFLLRHSSKKVISKKKLPSDFNQLEKEFDKSTIDQILKEIKKLSVASEKMEHYKEQLLKEEQFLSHWQYLDVNPNEIEKSQYYASFIGSISTSVQEAFLKIFSSQEECLFEQIYEDKTRAYYILITLKEKKEVLKEYLQAFSFHFHDYPYAALPQQAYRDHKRVMERQNYKEKKLQSQIDEAKKHMTALYQAEEIFLAQLEREFAKERIARNQNNIVLLKGWIPADEKPQIRMLLEAETDLKVPLCYSFSPVIKTDKDIPVLLKNHNLVAPFEIVTEMYSLPKYGEIDPTPVLTPFYMVFFGMMSADAGYGLLLFVGTILAEHFVPMRKNMKRFVRLFKIVSIPVILWGIVYGSFFGFEMPFVFLSLTEDMNSILILSVFFGFIQVITGLLINGIQSFKRRQYLSSFENGFAWMCILFGIFLITVNELLLAERLLFISGLLLAMTGAAGIILIPAIQRKNKLKGLAIGAYNLYGITGYVSDLVSYTRLMALGVAGGSIATAFNMLISFMPKAAQFTIGIVLFLVLHALNIFLTFLGAYVHGARLQFIEFFGKFYEGGGRKFSPLKPKEKYMDFFTNRDRD